MKLAYVIVAMAASLVFAVIKQFFPDFPVEESVFVEIVVWLLLMLGVEVVGKPLAARVRGLIRRFRK